MMEAELLRFVIGTPNQIEVLAEMENALQIPDSKKIIIQREARRVARLST